MVNIKIAHPGIYTKLDKSHINVNPERSNSMGEGKGLAKTLLTLYVI